MSNTPLAIARREMLARSSLGFGSLACSALLDQAKAGGMIERHLSPKVRNIIFLFMEGGVSQVDSFDLVEAS